MEPDEDTFWTDIVAIKARYPSVHATVEDDDGMAYIADIWSDNPGDKSGTRFMEEVNALADRCDMDIGLDPADSGGRKLVNWYVELGYQEARYGRYVRQAQPSNIPGLR